MIHEKFELYITDAEGNCIGEKRTQGYTEMRATLAILFSGVKLSQVYHWLDLAHAAPGHEVDCTEWNNEGALVRSARLRELPKLN